MTDVVVVLTTVPGDGTGEALARQLVEERLAACASLHAEMVSIYRWKGQLEREPERQLVIKTSRDRVAALEARLKALHAYDVPEFLVLPVEGASEAYRAWVVEQTRA